jgi:hypothetical protein
MKNFEFKSQICTTKEQSEKLLALGLKKETADMVHYFSQSLAERWVIVPLDNGEVAKNDDLEIPAWSLHRLLQIINRDMIIKPYTTFDDIIADIEGLIKTQFIDWRYLEEDK